VSVFWLTSSSLMMEEVRFSETSANIYRTTWRNIPEDSHLHTRRRENLKYHQLQEVLEIPLHASFCLVRIISMQIPTARHYLKVSYLR
jgi:hypothetical protein